jgi:hypothetical protein
MKKLDIRLFTSVENDLESRQLHILAALQHAQRQFTLNKLYPSLSDLIETRNLLQLILQQMDKVNEQRPQSLKSIDLEKQTLIFEYSDLPDTNMDQVRSLIEWTLPRLDSIIREGTVIFDFVEAQLHIKTVGIIPKYLLEGYLFVPDLVNKELAIYHYEMSLFRHFEDRYRTLKSTLINRYDESKFNKELHSLKLELIKANKNLPNPATFSISNELDFPFDETILPIVKRLFTIMLTKSQNIQSGF